MISVTYIPVYIHRLGTQAPDVQDFFSDKKNIPATYIIMSCIGRGYIF